MCIRSQSSSGSFAFASFHASKCRKFTLCRAQPKMPKSKFAELAQLVEHWLPKPRVAGSSPVFRSSFSKMTDDDKKVTEKFAGVK